jgi:hypothetical protein
MERQEREAQGQAEANSADPAEAPQPDVVMDVAEAGDTGLVETPEAEAAPAEKPKRKPRRRKPQHEAGPSDEPKAAE